VGLEAVQRSPVEVFSIAILYLILLCIAGWASFRRSDL
jgi:hypothetical protein